MITAYALTVQQIMLTSSLDKAYNNEMILACASVIVYLIQQNPILSCDMDSTLPALLDCNFTKSL